MFGLKTQTAYNLICSPTQRNVILPNKMETRITHSLIKAVSGEFDLENISKLSLCRMSENSPDIQSIP